MTTKTKTKQKTNKNRTKHKSQTKQRDYNKHTHAKKSNSHAHTRTNDPHKVAEFTAVLQSMDHAKSRFCLQSNFQDLAHLITWEIKKEVIPGKSRMSKIQVIMFIINVISNVIVVDSVVDIQKRTHLVVKGKHIVTFLQGTHHFSSFPKDYWLLAFYIIFVCL